MSKESRILKQLKDKQFEPKTPIASEMFLPNNSGLHRNLLFDTGIGRRLAIGNQAIIIENAMIRAAETMTDKTPTSWDSGSFSAIIGGTMPGTLFSATMRGFLGGMNFQPTTQPAVGAPTVIGGVFDTTVDNVAKGGAVIGGDFRCFGNSAGATGNWTNFYGGRFRCSHSGSGTITNGYGCYITTMNDGTYTNAVGLQIDAITIGGTIRRGARINNRVDISSPDADNQTVLFLDQNDGTTEMIKFEGTSGADATSTISTLGTAGTVAGWMQVNLNGAKRWIAIYNDPS